MADFQIAYHATDKIATVQSLGDALPAGATKVGEFTHDHVDDELGTPTADNHVFYHHVRDALYFIQQFDMQSVSIVIDSVYVALVSYTLVPGTVTLAPAATQQITHVFTPSGASNQSMVYTTSDATKATVSASGLITAVATGSATITSTSVDGDIEETCVVTIS